MSSEALEHSDPTLFRCKRRVPRDEYVIAHYLIETAVDPEQAAQAMAREQSACTETLPTADGGLEVKRHTARVCWVETLGRTGDALLPQYRLNTPVYAAPELDGRTFARAIVRIAFPHANFGASVTRMLNHMLGELPRLGFLNAVRLLEVDMPATLLSQFSGPRFGVGGVRAQLGVPHRPLFCRATRPAIGLSTAQMVAINREVLRGGFDLVKDDELTQDTERAPAADRCEAIQALLHEVQSECGERKGFFVNLVDDPMPALRIAAAAQANGVFGALVAPGLQGWGAIEQLGAAHGLAVLAHNTGSDALIRNPRVGLAATLWIKLCRLAGADLVMLPGEFATGGMSAQEERACTAAALAPLGQIRPSMPILCGGKRADLLAHYRDLVGCTDFMLIVAAAVDHHPDGPRAGARAFREAWDAIATT